MKLDTGNDIAAERRRRRIGQSWLAARLKMSKCDLGTIERLDLPLSADIIAGCTMAFEHYDQQQSAAA